MRRPTAAPLAVRCSTYGCTGEPVGRFLNGYKCEAHAPSQPTPPAGTTAADLYEQKRVKLGNDAASVIDRIPLRERAFHGTLCRSEQCAAPGRHDHGAPRGHAFACSNSCPCRKRWDLWKGPRG